jgi:uncharacterized protein (DUF433 family)
VKTVVIPVTQTYPQDLEGVQRALPHLHPDQINAALNYYQSHTEEIDRDIERQQRALRELQIA